MNLSWYYPSFAALCLYGAWGYWGTRASNFINPLSITFYSSLGVLISGVFALVLLGFKPELSARGTLYGFLNGLAKQMDTLRKAWSASEAIFFRWRMYLLVQKKMSHLLLPIQHANE